MDQYFYFQERGEYDFRDEAIVSCYLGKVFRFWRRRNAYYGLPSFKSSLFTFDLDCTKSEIENGREKGSSWEIEEIPVIVLAGERKSLVVGQQGSDPFVACLPLRKPRSTLEPAGEFFAHAGAFCIICGRGAVPPARLPFCSHKSSSIGGNWRLSWRTSVEADLKLDAALRLILRFTKRIQRPAQGT